MSLPPARRSVVSAPLQDTLRHDGLQLQVCARCDATQYPPRERCAECLADALAWQTVDGHGTVLAVSALAYSLEPWFSERLPWQVASLRLDAGPVVFAHLAAQASPGDRLHVHTARDASGSWCLVACDGQPDSLPHALTQLEMSS
jgi:uncharacterized OB-fold protein